MKPWPTGPHFRVIAVLCSLGLSGCASGLESDYGSSRGKSINGTAVLASMLRDQAHEVRTAIRLTDELAEWSEGIVRFAPFPGPPTRDEANWYRDWLGADVNRWLIYVVRDFDATHEYWVETLAQLPASENPDHRTEAEEARDKAADWVNRLPQKASEVADAKEWFKLEAEWNPPRILTKLSGPWARGIDVKAAALTAHEPLHASGARVLLTGDDKPFVLEKPMADYGRVLIIANGSFLLNEPLVNSAPAAGGESGRVDGGHRSSGRTGRGPLRVGRPARTEVALGTGDASVSTSAGHSSISRLAGGLAALALRLAWAVPDPTLPPTPINPPPTPGPWEPCSGESGRRPKHSNCSILSTMEIPRYAREFHARPSTDCTRRRGFGHAVVTKTGTPRMDEIVFEEESATPVEALPGQPVPGVELDHRPSRGEVASWAHRIVGESNKVFVGQRQPGARRARRRSWPRATS